MAIELGNNKQAKRIKKANNPLAEYSTTELTFPEDLITNKKYGSSYAVFYINEYDGVTTKSKKSATVATAQMGTSKQITGNDGNTQQAATAGATVGAVKNISGGSSQITKGVVKGGTAGAVVNTAASLVGLNASQMGATRKRLKSAIVLPIPNDLAITDSFTWSEEDGAITTAVNDAFNAVSSAMSSEEKFKSLKNLLGIGSQNAVDLIAAKTGSHASGIGALNRLYVNPKTEVLFKGVGYRSFSWTYSFYPTTIKEAEIVHNIVKQFRFAAHPDFTNDSQFIYVWPSDVDVVFYHSGTENKYLPKLPSLAITQITANYSPDQIFSTLADVPGSPVGMSFTIQLKELATVSKVELEQGY
jgi:hypothetical protein